MEVTKEFRVVAGSDLLVKSPHGGHSHQRDRAGDCRKRCGTRFSAHPKAVAEGTGEQRTNHSSQPKVARRSLGHRAIAKGYN